jgi:tetratricopeptide (TPR) repeat protein
MFCKICGNKIDDDSIFCSFCGAKQSEVNKSIVSELSDPKTVNVNLSFGRQNTLNPSQEKVVQRQSKYDLTYEGDSEAAFVGSVILVSSICLTIFKPFKFDDYESLNEFKAFLSIATLVLRILVTNWVVNIAKRQNRETWGWGFLAFFLPSIALIIIGLQKKLRYTLQIDSNLPITQQVDILLQKANQFYDDKRYLECCLVCNKIIELDEECNSALKFRGISFYKTKEYDKAKSDFDLLNLRNKFGNIIYYYLGCIELEKRNIQEAISYWKIAKENGNEKVQVELDRYYTFYGKYFLESNDVQRKVADSAGFTPFNDGEYVRGITELDQIKKIATQINAYEFGLEIELRKNFKTYYLGISYFEILDITYNDIEHQFTLFLAENIELIFSYNLNKDTNNGLKKVCEKIEVKYQKKVTVRFDK